MTRMRTSDVVRRARAQAGLSLRALADRAGTSHSTIAAYEAGTKQPTVATLDRILEAAGFAADVTLRRRVRGTPDYPRGQELVDALELAAVFPARHAPTLPYPPFGASR